MATLGASNDPIFRFGEFPTQQEVQFGGIKQNEKTIWDSNGLLQLHTDGNWKIEGAMENGKYQQSKSYSSEGE